MHQRSPSSTRAALLIAHHCSSRHGSLLRRCANHNGSRLPFVLTYLVSRASFPQSRVFLCHYLCRHCLRRRAPMRCTCALLLSTRADPLIAHNCSSRPGSLLRRCAPITMAPAFLLSSPILFLARRSPDRASSFAHSFGRRYLRRQALMRIHLYSSSFLLRRSGDRASCPPLSSVKPTAPLLSNFGSHDDERRCVRTLLCSRQSTLRRTTPLLLPPLSHPTTTCADAFAPMSLPTSFVVETSTPYVLQCRNHGTNLSADATCDSGRR